MKRLIAAFMALAALLGAAPSALADAAQAADVLRITESRLASADKESLDATGNGALTQADAELLLMETVSGGTGSAESFTGLLKEKYIGRFTLSGAVRSGTGVPFTFKNEKVSVQTEKRTVTTDDGRPAVYFIADIYIRDIESFRTWYSDEKFGLAEAAADAARSVGAVIAISGDFFSQRSRGLCIRNGVILRDSLEKKRDVCVLYRDGTMETYLAGKVSVKAIESRDPWQAWSFGPALLDEDGHAKTSFNTNVARKNPRSAIGYYEPGHYCFVVVDGRQRSYSYGMSMTELSELFEQLGCKAAYNLDGGATAVMADSFGELNRRWDTDRQCSDILYISA